MEKTLIEKVRELNKERTQGEWVANTDELYPCLAAGDETISMCIPHDSIGLGFEDSEFCSIAPEMAQSLLRVYEVLKNPNPWIVSGLNLDQKSFNNGYKAAFSEIRKAIEGNNK